MTTPDGAHGHPALSNRLTTFRKWIATSGGKVHPAVCIVNGEATDGTRNAPVLLLGPPPGGNPPMSGAGNVGASSGDNNERRNGMVDTENDRVLYDRTIGCQIRTAREMKEGQVMMSVPRHIMVTPDLVAGSDAGWAALSCIEGGGGSDADNSANFWDAFGHSGEKEKGFLDKFAHSKGTQILVKILQERKKVVMALAKAAEAVEAASSSSGSEDRKSVV